MPEQEATSPHPSWAGEATPNQNSRWSNDSACRAEIAGCDPRSGSKRGYRDASVSLVSATATGTRTGWVTWKPIVNDFGSHVAAVESDLDCEQAKMTPNCGCLDSNCEVGHRRAKPRGNGCAHDA
jgi:hypothetical protein